MRRAAINRQRSWPWKPALLLAVFCSMSAPAWADENTLSGNFLFNVISSSEPHREAIRGLLRGRRGLPSWVRNMVTRGDYVAIASVEVSVDGKPMQLFSACEAGRCADSSIKVLFSADGKRAVLDVRDKKLGGTTLGEPTPAEASVLLKDK
ncbi:MAG: Ivy family c-type lysozyme inhibitor [Allorhizobium sp.]